MGALCAVVLGATPLAVHRTGSETVRVAGQPLLVHHYEPAGGAPRCPSVLLLSGDGGWQLGVVEWAERLADLGYEVIGVDATRLVKIAGPRGLAGVVAEWPDLARLTTRPPVLLGYSRGATLGLAFAERAPSPPPAVLMGVDLEDHFGGAPVPIGLSPGVHRHGDYAVDLRHRCLRITLARPASPSSTGDAIGWRLTTCYGRGSPASPSRSDS